MNSASKGTLPPPLSIGVSPLTDPLRWLAPDDDLAWHLAEKEKLIETFPDRVFRAEPDTLNAQREVADLFGRHLPAAFPETYRRTETGIAIAKTGRSVDLDPSSPRLIERAGRLVADDLVIMRKKPGGWTLVAASLCFPTYWNLAEKFAKPLSAVHAPVPGFGAGTRNAMLIERIFDRLQKDQIVQRSNWSVHNDGVLHHIEPHSISIQGETIDDLARLFLRREYQTLRKLAGTGDILFTIRIAVDPMKDVGQSPALAGSLAGRLRELDAGALEYKGLKAARDRLARYLDTVATGG